ncbi:MAG: hypothetical protein IKH45_05920 [Neisseriaceae bacterium]|nr:hypothetical protein [Neisseriaceae bacterium]
MCDFFRLPETKNLTLCVIARFFRRKNRGNPVLPTGKTNATGVLTALH